MMKSRTAGGLLVAGGLGLAVLSLASDVVRSNAKPGFGSTQQGLLALGIGMSALGWLVVAGVIPRLLAAPELRRRWRMAMTWAIALPERVGSAIDRYAAVLAAGLTLIMTANALEAKLGSWADLPERFTGSNGYSEIGWSWADGAALHNGRPPVYPLLLGVWARLFGREASLYLTVATQVLLIALVALLVYRLAAKYARRPRWALLAVALVVANFQFLMECLARRETAIYATILVLLFLGVSRRSHRRVLGAGALGAVSALGWLTRPSGILLAPAVLFVWLADRSARGSQLRARLAVFFVALCLPLAAWLAYQAAHGQALHLSGDDNAKNLYKGNNAALMSIYPFVDVDYLAPHMRRLAMNWDRQGLDVDRELRRRAIQFMVDEPMDTLILAQRKLMAFFVPVPFPRGTGTVRRTPSGDFVVDD